MSILVEERAAMLGEYIVKNKTTVRATAKVFGISKSTVHMDVAQRLERYDPQLYSEVKKSLKSIKQKDISEVVLQQKKNILIKNKIKQRFFCKSLEI